MLKRISAVLAAMALGSATLVASPAAAKAPPAEPTALTAAPAPVIVSSGAGTAANFTFSTPDTGSAKLVNPDGANVALTVSGSPNYSASRTFTFADKPGVWKLVATATKAGESSSVTKEFQVHWVTAIDFDAAPDVVDQFDKVALSGTLTYREGSAAKAYDNQKVWIAFKPVGGGGFTRVGWDVTDAQGRFKVVRSAEKSGWWRAEFDGASDTEPSVSDSDRVDVRPKAQTARISGFDAFPEPVSPGATLHLRGTLEIGHWRVWDPIKFQQVTIQFKPADGYRWFDVTSDRTDFRGVFSAEATARQSGWWRAVYAGSHGVKGTTSEPDFVKVAKPLAATRIVRFNASPEPVRKGRNLSVKGALQAWSAGWSGYGDQKVTLWFKTKHGHWRYVKTIWTDGDGGFWSRTKAKRSGWWKVVFAGNDEAAGSAGASDFVRVKR